MSPRWDDYERRPRRPADGIKAQSTRGKIGATWWAGRWIAALERLVDTGRLSRGRSYARSGQVLNIDITSGKVESRVQGSRSTPYKVRIAIRPLDARAWSAVADAMAAQAIFAAKLLAGEMPQNIEEAFAAAGASLFPDKHGDLETNCSCPDYANPCKHIAAVYYLLGEQFDADPFLIFRLRGRDKEQIIADLRARRSSDTPAQAAAQPQAAAPSVEPPAPLDTQPERFWAAPDDEDLEHVRVVITAPPVDAAMVKRLGAPPFWRGSPEFAALMGQAYARITSATLAVAFGEEKPSAKKPSPSPKK